MESHIVEEDSLDATKGCLRSGKGKAEDRQDNMRDCPALVSAIVVVEHCCSAIWVRWLWWIDEGTIVCADWDADQEHQEGKH